MAVAHWKRCMQHWNISLSVAVKFSCNQNELYLCARNVSSTANHPWLNLLYKRSSVSRPTVVLQTQVAVDTAINTGHHSMKNINIGTMAFQPEHHQNELIFTVESECFPIYSVVISINIIQLSPYKNKYTQAAIYRWISIIMIVISFLRIGTVTRLSLL